MATASYYPRREVSLSETDLEKKVGDLLHRQRKADSILHMVPGESQHYGPLKVRRKPEKFLVAGVDGEPMEPIPFYDFDASEMASLLDQKIENSLSQL